MVLILPRSINHNFINRGWVTVIFGKYSHQHQYSWYKTKRNSFILTFNITGEGALFKPILIVWSITDAILEGYKGVNWQPSKGLNIYRQPRFREIFNRQMTKWQSSVKREIYSGKKKKKKKLGPTSSDESMAYQMPKCSMLSGCSEHFGTVYGVFYWQSHYFTDTDKRA